MPEKVEKKQNVFFPAALREVQRICEEYTGGNPAELERRLSAGYPFAHDTGEYWAAWQQAMKYVGLV